jgi:hypothetical protein
VTTKFEKETMKYFAVLMQLLRERAKFIEEISEGTKLNNKIISLLIASSVFFAIYGAIMGAFGGWMQMLASGIKLPALYLLTGFICLPTLYFFDVISGSKRTFSQYLALLLAALSIISVMLFAFAPVTLFFLLSINEYRFFLLLNVAILAFTGIIGVNFFYKNMKSFTTDNYGVTNGPTTTAVTVSDSSKKSSKLLEAWLCLFMLVGSQLGWTLRPFFGSPNLPFAFFRPIESNFYAELFDLIFRYSR